MNTITVCVVGFSGLFISLGALFGVTRQRNRSLARLILMVISFVMAMLLKDIIADAIINIPYQDGTLGSHILSTFYKSDMILSNDIKLLLISIIETIISFLVFLITFGVLSFVSWLIGFQILKLVVAKEFKPNAWQCVIIGIVQGILVAYLLCAPFSVMAVEVNKINNLTYQNEQMFEFVDKQELNGYANSTVSKVYYGAGKWFFDIISSTKDSNGNKMEINEATDLAITSIKLSEAFTKIAPNVENISEMSESNKLIALEKTQCEIENIGTILSKFDYNSKVVLQDMMPGIKETVTFNYGKQSEPINYCLDKLIFATIKYTKLPNCLNSIITIVENGNNNNLSQEQVDEAVNVLIENSWIMDLFITKNGICSLVDVNDEMEIYFVISINNANISNEFKANLYTLFGIEEN